MSETKPVDSAVTAEPEKSEPSAPSKSDPEETTSTDKTADSETAKAPPIDLGGSKEGPAEPIASVATKSEPLGASSKTSKPVINLEQYQGSVDASAAKPTGPSGDAMSNEDTLAEKTSKLAVNDKGSTAQADGAGDGKKLSVSAEFKKLADSVVKIIEEVKYDEMWGVTLTSPADTHVPTQVVIQKFLNANDNDVAKAEDQFRKALEWRKETKPLELLKRKYDPKRFDDLGFVTSYPSSSEGEPADVFTWNVYGTASAGGKIEEVFGNLKDFMAWRIALQELGLQALNLSAATKPITLTDDPYKIVQVHDYKNVTFFSQPPAVKAASKEVIRVFGQNYPELLK
ncbi:MAG: hypothetical protein Q9227_001469, partial [Pyrenula ochraceoflavens]